MKSTLIQNFVEIRETPLSELGYNTPESGEDYLHLYMPVVDVETVDLLQNVPDRDPKKLTPSVVGIAYKDRIIQFILLDRDTKCVAALRTLVRAKLDEMCCLEADEINSEQPVKMRRPFFGFSSHFDQDVLYGLIGRRYKFVDCQEYDGQAKSESAAQKGIILRFRDPFFNGLSAPAFYDEYLRTKRRDLLEDIITHNQACLLCEFFIAWHLMLDGRWMW